MGQRLDVCKVPKWLYDDLIGSYSMAILKHDFKAYYGTWMPRSVLGFLNVASSLKMQVVLIGLLCGDKGDFYSNIWNSNVPFVRYSVPMIMNSILTLVLNASWNATTGFHSMGNT